MRSKRLRNALQNLALVLLSLSALFLLSRLPLFHTSWAVRVQSLLSARPADSGQTQTGGLGEMFPAVHVMVTGDIEYGRYGRLYVSNGDALLGQMVSLFQEALGSATELGAAADKTLRTALDAPGLYLDLTGQLPLEAVAAWLGERVEMDRDVRSMALTCEEESNAVLYLRSEAGEIFRCATALPVSAVQAVCEGQSPNGSTFAYESNYATLDPYAILVAETEAVPAVRSELPAAYSAYNLLTALDFNPHTVFRYTESGGAEVVEESPRTLRIAPDGLVSFTSRGEAASPLYRVSASGEKAEIREALSAAWRLAQALTEGAGASGLSLGALEEREDGWTVLFRYQAAGLPVYFADESYALAVTISGGAVTAFTYRCRAYTAGEETAELLPPAMAQAIASLYPGAGLSLGYVDGGGGEMTAQWLAR